MSKHLSSESETKRFALPRGWVQAQLGDLVEILDNKRVPVNAEERAVRLGDIPYYGATGQVGWIDDFLFDEELVLLGEDAAPFLDPTKPVAYLIKGKSWVNNHAHVLRGSHSITNRFLLHQLNTTDYQPFVTGTTRLKLSQKPMRAIPLRLAPLPEQHRIVAEIEKHFTRLDDAVSTLERVQASLKQARASILNTAVAGRLVPTEAALARAEGRAYEPASALLGRILAERKRKHEEKYGKKYKPPVEPEAEGAPSLAEGWVWVTVDQLCIEVTDGDHQPPPVTEEGIPFLVIGDVRTGRPDFSASRKVAESYYSSLAWKRKPDSSDLLYTVVGSYGIPVRITDDRPFCVQRHIAILKSPWPEAKDYFLRALASASVFRQASEKATGTAQKTLGLHSLRHIAIPLPPAAEQFRIVTEVERRLSVLDALDQTIHQNLSRCAHLRQSILKRAFSGKLVPQDPTDEPASALLARIQASAAP